MCVLQSGQLTWTHSLQHLCLQVGDVLVERTVAEVRPAVLGNKEQLDLVMPL